MRFSFRTLPDTHKFKNEIGPNANRITTFLTTHMQAGITRVQGTAPVGCLRDRRSIRTAPPNTSSAAIHTFGFHIIMKDI
jgi:hypothetical protein